MDQDEDTISYLVNNLPVIVKKELDDKTILSIYCQQNNLVYPKYKVTLIHPHNRSQVNKIDWPARISFIFPKISEKKNKKNIQKKIQI